MGEIKKKKYVLKDFEISVSMVGKDVCWQDRKRVFGRDREDILWKVGCCVLEGIFWKDIGEPF